MMTKEIQDLIDYRFNCICLMEGVTGEFTPAEDDTDAEIKIVGDYAEAGVYYILQITGKGCYVHLVRNADNDAFSMEHLTGLVSINQGIEFAAQHAFDNKVINTI